jgi:hypothetical protein
VAIILAGVALVAAVLVAITMPPKHLEEKEVEEALEESLAQPAIQTGT